MAPSTWLRFEQSVTFDCHQSAESKGCSGLISKTVLRKTVLKRLKAAAGCSFVNFQIVAL